ncbi:MAG: arabinofuranosidase [Panacagrimonas sp.]|jgi:DNA-binding response OmpR family regulator|nr:response regulator transcription factor [Panacagrimonas sp.]MCC2657709.1 arabinofuranosidase [Panacagrimonas sp.]
MPSSPPRILIADDDRELCALLAEYLGRNQLAAEAVHSAESAIERLHTGARPDVLVLDVMLPGMDGLTALRRIREFESLPIVMLSGRGEPVDRIMGLELGADDYLAKPCLPRELLARIQALLRRTRGDIGPEPVAEIQVGRVRIKPADRRASCGDEALPLTGAELSVLIELARQAGQTVTREQLTQGALHRALERYDRAIDVHVSRLRQKLTAADCGLRIETIRGAGYQLIVDEAPA